VAGDVVELDGWLRIEHGGSVWIHRILRKIASQNFELGRDGAQPAAAGAPTGMEQRWIECAGIGRVR
jgi:hypothetical protein